MSNINKINFFEKASDNEINKYFDKLGKIALHKGGKYNNMYLDDISLLNKNRQHGGLIDCMFGKIGEGSNCSDQKWQKLQNDLKTMNKNKKLIPSNTSKKGKNGINNSTLNPIKPNSEMSEAFS